MSQRCIHCGERIDPEEWHPVTTVRDDDGTAEILDFCGEDCRDTWQSDDANTSE